LLLTAEGRMIKSMLTLRLKYTESPGSRGGAITIVLSQYSVDADRDMCLTHECRSVDAVQQEVERLKRELDAILRQSAEKLR
jgi:hypothetical protein